MKRTHWFTSPDPPKFGEDLVALCGRIVPKAQPVKAIWEEGEPLMTCRECDQGRASDRYAAVIQSGEESIER